MGTTPGKNGLTYADAGVDIDAGNELVRRIGPIAKSTARSGSDAGLGGFGGLFDLKAAGFEDPVLVAANDGTGTKLKIAIETNDVSTIGIDLVAMCVNDLIVQGAEPLFFLDYFSTGHLEIEQATKIIEGIAEGCRQADCALIGGETAEMPGLYAKGDFDLAGFSVGAAERGTLLPTNNIAAGDALIGLPSSGVHSNGFSLVRKILEINGLDWSSPAPFEDGKTLGEAFLTPTKIYVKELLPLLQSGLVKALAHITGGGLPENLPRVLPEGLGAKIDTSTWDRPPVFSWLQKSGGIEEAELLRTFNCGIGMVLVVSPEEATRLDLPDAVWIGEITDSGTVEIA